MISLSDIDQRRFGHVIAKTEIGPDDDVEAILAQCVEREVRLLIARCPTLELGQVQHMERLGFFLTDTLVYYRKKRVAPGTLVLPEGFIARPATAGDAPEVERLAARAFSDYFGHYHADPRLEKSLCDAVYSSWAANSCSLGEFCSHVVLIVSKLTGAIVAFATLKRHDDAQYEGVLFGVDPAYQGKGLYALLMDLSQQWGVDNGLVRMVVSTQVTNVAVQKAWCRQGFEPFRSCYTFHKWLA